MLTAASDAVGGAPVIRRPRLPWTLTTHAGIELSPLGWAAQVIPLLLIGVLLGEVVDRFRQAEAERRRLEAAARSHREAVEINDTIVQGLTAAKWSLEAGDAGRALDLMTETLDLGHRLVSDLIRQAQISESWTGDQRDGRGSGNSSTQSM